MLEQTNPYAHRRIAIDGRLDVQPAADCARFNLRFAPEKREMAENALGLALPAKIGLMAEKNGFTAACIGPDEWYILADEDKASALIAASEKLYAAEPHSLVDISHRETGIELKGREAAWLLNAALPVNLEEMAAPGAARTIFDRVQIILLKYASEHYRIEVWNSFGDHVWTLLETASHEVELSI
ncbi:sarcosine oxidase subunit gamma [Daeguia caeni]|uniref:Sarcosine oxidase subunit gamma n=1 Tax=Daeguia caeni TaxID=439612 RepID=A0ABV9H2W5_9HYPH